MQEFAESGHPVFRCSAPLSKGVLRSKGGGRHLIQYTADPSCAEMLMKTIAAVSPLSISEQWQFGILAKARMTPSISKPVDLEQDFLTRPASL